MDYPFKILCSQVLVCAPIDLVKVRLQGQTTAERYRGPIHCVAVILQQEGVRGLYRGGAALALRDVPCYGLYFLPYELIRKALTETGEEPGQAELTDTRNHESVRLCQDESQNNVITVQ